MTQVGSVALALVLGRRLTTDDYPAKISEVVDSAMTHLESGESEPIPVLLRAWIRSALQLEPRHSFVSAIGAKKDLEIALSHASPDAERASLRAFLTKYAGAVLADRSSELQAAPPSVPEQLAETPLPMPFTAVPAPVAPPVPVVAPAPAAMTPPTPAAPPLPAPPTVAAVPTPIAVTATPAPTLAPMPTPTPTPVPVPVPSLSTSPVLQPAVTLPAAAPAVAPAVASPAPASISTSPTAVPAPAASATPFPASPAKPPAQASAPPPPPTAPAAPRPIWMNPWAGAAAAAVVIVATLGFTLTRPGSAPPPATGNGTLTVGTSPEGATVLVDGVNRGLTPLNLSLSPGEHVLELVTNGERRRIPVTLTAGGQVSHYFDLPKTSPTGTGSLQVRSDPPKARVTVDGQPFGRTPTVVTGLTPGPHQVLLETDTERVSEQVVIEAGVTASLVVPMKSQPTGGGSGWIAVSVPAEVQIYENQRLLGDQPHRSNHGAGGPPRPRVRERVVGLPRDALGGRRQRASGLGAARLAARHGGA